MFGLKGEKGEATDREKERERERDARCIMLPVQAQILVNTVNHLDDTAFLGLGASCYGSTELLSLNVW